MSTNNAATILHILPGKVPPKDHIQAVKTIYPTVYGFAVQHEGKLVCEKFDVDYPIDQIMKMISHEEVKLGHRLLFFANYPTFADKQDVQPFVVAQEGKAIVALMYEGDFEKKWGGMNGKHTAEFNNADENLFPRLGKAIEEADGDDIKLQKELSSDGVQRVFKNTYDKRGWFTFLLATGAPIAFGANEVMKGYDWGTISNGTNVLIPEAKKEEPKPVVKKDSFGLDFLSGDAPPAAAPAPVVPENMPIIQPEPAKTDTKLSYTMMSIPPQLDAGVRNRFIRLFFGRNAIALSGDGDGELPGNHQAKECVIPVHPALVPIFAAAVEDFKKKAPDQRAIKKYEEQLRGLAKKRGPVDMPAAGAELEAGIIATNGDKPVTNGTREPASNYMPRMSEPEIAQQTEKWMKILDNQSAKRPDPTALAKMEERYPPYSTSVGVKFEDMYLRTPEELIDLFGRPGGIAYLEIRRKLMAAANVKLEDLVNTLPAAKQVEVPSPQPVATTPEQPLKKVSGLEFL